MLLRRGHVPIPAARVRTRARGVGTCPSAGAVVAAASIVLAGCSSMPPVPAGPTDAEVAALVQERFDGTWENLDLPAGTPRPVVEDPRSLPTDQWWEQLANCMGASGISSWGLGADAQGYTFIMGDNEALTPDQAVDAYTCLIATVEDPVASGAHLTDDQADYVWEYYGRWLVPCIQREGFALGGGVPSRTQFDEQRAAGYLWSPYHSVPSDDQASLRRLSEHCGPERGGLGGGRWFG